MNTPNDIFIDLLNKIEKSYKYIESHEQVYNMW